MNVWGFAYQAKEKDRRMPSIQGFLLDSGHDIVLLQEVWYKADYDKLKQTYPYATPFGSPVTILCPRATSTPNKMQWTSDPKQASDNQF